MLATAASGQDRTYEAGQVWAYETAPSDTGSLILIQEVDQIGPEENPTTVYHISMIGIQVPAQDFRFEVGHLPVSQETLDASVTSLADTEQPFPPYSEGKQMWAEANGGVFTITLAEIADFLREQIAPQMGSPST